MAAILEGGSIEERGGGGARLGRLDLVVAIACLGALAAVALPGQRAVTAETRRMETAALASSLRSAADLGHSLWLARGAPDTLEIERDGATVRVAMRNGYPSAASLPLLLEEPETNGFAQTGDTWRHEAGGAGKCRVTYEPARSPGAKPHITSHLEGC